MHADASSPAAAAAFSPGVSPLATPATAPALKLLHFPDIHAEKLFNLDPIPYHMPETTIARLIGFGDDVSKLRAWVGKMGTYGNVWAFHAYEDRYFEGRAAMRYWIIGDCDKPTCADVGIVCPAEFPCRRAQPWPRPRG